MANQQGALVSPRDVDTTLLLDDLEQEDCRPCDQAGQSNEPLLSLVTLNAKKARTVDIVRGVFVVQKELPTPALAPRTVQISCGRHAGNTIVLEDSRVSLRHFAVRVRISKGVVVLDLLDLSSNGTWVNGQRVGRGKRVTLSVGDRIVVLPALEVGQESETAYILLHDPKGVGCSMNSAEAASAPCADVGALATPSASAPVVDSPPHIASKDAILSNVMLPTAIERDLRCGICTDALHRCLTIVPCGHNFCTSCLVRWRRTSPKCPECRAHIGQATQNHDLDKVVAAFVAAHPSMARSSEELHSLDACFQDANLRAVLRWLLRDGPLRDAQKSEKPSVINAVPTPARSHAAQSSRNQVPTRQTRQTPRGSSACVVS